PGREADRYSARAGACLARRTAGPGVGGRDAVFPGTRSDRDPRDGSDDAAAVSRPQPSEPAVHSQTNHRSAGECLSGRADRGGNGVSPSADADGRGCAGGGARGEEMMRFLCKDCWIAHEASTLLARCKRCEVNAQIERRDPLQSKAASVSNFPLVCRLHPSEPLDIYCGTCEREVPPRTLIGDRSIIAVLGDTASGKTSLLWVLSERLRKPNEAGVFIRQ